MSFRKIQTIGRSNKSKLLNEFGFRNINEAIEYYELDSKRRKYSDMIKNKAYLLMKDDYNDIIEQQQQSKKEDKKIDKKWKGINRKYNSNIVNVPFVNITLPFEEQYSIKFAMGSNSFKLKKFTNTPDKNQIEFLQEFYINKYKLKDNKFITPAWDILFRRIYDTLMLRTGQLNRIYITLQDSKKTYSTKLLNSISYEMFKDLLEKEYIMEDLWNLDFTIQYRNFAGGNGVEAPKFLEKRGVSIIHNDDGFCGQRCLVLADCKTNDLLRNMKTAKSKDKFNNRTIEMCKELNINCQMSFTDFNVYANLRNKQIVILAGLFVELYSTETDYDDKVYIYWDDKIKHYHFIHDINAATNDKSRNNKWCKSCNKSIRRENFNGHKCKESVCGCCRVNFCSVIEKENHFKKAKINKLWVKCDICNLYCAGKECLEKHIEFCKGKSKKCEKCKKWIDTERFEEHKCDETYCDNCKTYHFEKTTHRCFIQKLKPDIDENGNLKEWKQDIYAYDFEAMFDDNYNHIVNLCVVKKLFTDEVYKFGTIEEFVKWFLKLTNSTFIAHNGKAYDTWLVHKYIIKHTNKKPNKLILAGNKIMYMKINTIRFIDSINHIAGSLANFTKTFKITEAKKGYFPYLFNTKGNQKYIGKIPDIKYFNVNGLSVNKDDPHNIHDFKKWYECQKDAVYDFQKELYEYCLSDVDLLKRALEIYVKDALETTSIHPLKCSTIASYCMRVYRTNFMPVDTIAVLTKQEYDFIKRGFFGGRTECFKSFRKWTDDDIANGKYGKYIDIQSLYPSVQYFNSLPTGIPVWDIDPNFSDVKDYISNHYGYIECDIIAPSTLHIPLLPEKKDCKLMFDLVNKNNKVYSSIELLKAIEVGYTITKIHKSLSFEETSGLFQDYISTFLKIKTESAGYDGDNIEEYVREYEMKCGVKLNTSNIKKNAGRKALAKMCLNSLWGKFGQNDDMTQTEYLTNDKWFKLLKRHVDGKVELKNEVLIDEDTLYVSYIEKEEKKTSLTSTNLGLAGFVTASARLKLYDELYKLDKRVLYCDTDSIIYEYDKDLYNTTEGNSLGEWELEDDGNIKEFIGLAPKTYGYITLNSKVNCKCKGISLNYGNITNFNFDSLKQLVLGDTDKIVTYSTEFKKKDGVITTIENVPKVTTNGEDKKRLFNKDGTSSPKI